jgi:molybdopterin converting factor subunit 1
VEVTVRLFATLRQQAGWKERAFALAPGATVRTLIATLDAAQPELGLATRTFYAAVNEEYVKGDRVLEDGDAVGIFPPVSGGRSRE